MDTSSLAITVNRISADSANALDREPVEDRVDLAPHSVSNPSLATLVTGIPLLAAVGAPSSLAVRLANEFNVSLVGFLRDNAFNIYSAGERIN